jgi:hypothetical protein
MSNESRHPLNDRLARIQKRRSALLRQGRGCRRRGTTIAGADKGFPSSIALWPENSTKATPEIGTLASPPTLIPAREPPLRLVNGLIFKTLIWVEPCQGVPVPSSTRPASPPVPTSRSQFLRPSQNCLGSSPPRHRKLVARVPSRSRPGTPCPDAY